jgi:hypothetical protein
MRTNYDDDEDVNMYSTSKEKHNEHKLSNFVSNTKLKAHLLKSSKLLRSRMKTGKQPLLAAQMVPFDQDQA